MGTPMDRVPIFHSCGGVLMGPIASKPAPTGFWLDDTYAANVNL